MVFIKKYAMLIRYQGHDFFEGIYAYDVQFYIDYIINKEKLLTIDMFNKKLRGFVLSERDKKNRPKPFKNRKSGSKFDGNAGSLRILSRILTLMISVEAKESVVFPNLVKLQEVSELICAPVLNKYEIECSMNQAITEYLIMRVASIDSYGMNHLRPKHHYLSHYSDLYLLHGPLMYLWAMRMESKVIAIYGTAQGNRVQGFSLNQTIKCNKFCVLHVVRPEKRMYTKRKLLFFLTREFSRK